MAWPTDERAVEPADASSLDHFFPPDAGPIDGLAFGHEYRRPPVAPGPPRSRHRFGASIADDAERRRAGRDPAPSIMARSADCEGSSVSRARSGNNVIHVNGSLRWLRVPRISRARCRRPRRRSTGRRELEPRRQRAQPCEMVRSEIGEAYGEDHGSVLRDHPMRARGLPRAGLPAHSISQAHQARPRWEMS